MNSTEPVEIAEYGWTFYDKCRCAGKVRYKYRNKELNELELEWWPRFERFKVTYLGVTTKISPLPLIKLGATLKALVAEYA